MLIEDEIIVRQSMAAYLTDRNYTVIEVSDGKKGLIHLDKSRPDLVITDLRMPETNGLEVLSSIHNKYPELPVIVVSGTGDLSDVVESLRRGAWDFITKPIHDMSLLYHAVNTCLERAHLLKENQIYNQKLVDLVEKRTMALEQAQTLLNSIISTVPDIIYRLDENGNITFISNAVINYGYTVNELIGKHISEIVNKDDLKKVMVRMAERRTGDRKTKLLEVQLIRKDKKAIPFEIKSKGIDDKITVLVTAEGMYSGSPDKRKFIGTQGIARDITERKMAEEENQKLEEQLFQSQKMESIGRMAGGLAHDFNNILTSIIGYAEILKMKHNDENSPEKSAVDVIYDSAQKMANLTKQILSFARKEKYEPQPIEVNGTIENTIKITEKIFEKNITIVKNFSKNIHIIEVDEGKLNQVFANLFINAKDAMPDGGMLKIGTENVLLNESFTRFIPDLSPGDYVKITISDSGWGIPPDIADKIFEPFFTTKDPNHGTGLGLSIVYGIVKKHGGHIEVESSVGKGTTFTLYFKASPSFLNPKRKNAQLYQGTGTVLIIDDEQNIRGLVKSQLESLGYSVYTAEQGLSAMRIFQKYYDTIEYVLLDMIMPNTDPVDLFTKMKSLKNDIKVIIISGYSKSDKVTSILKNGGKGFLSKPFTIQQLSEIMHNA